jgi:hypothetical protein
MSNLTTCHICNKNVSWPCKNKHHFSKNHKEDIVNALIKKKSAFVIWIDNVEKNIRQVIPSISFNHRNYKICFACKKIVPTSNDYITCPCKKTSENAKIIKSMLGDITELPITQSEQPTNSEEVEKLKKENISLNRRIKAQESRIESLEECEEGYDALYSILTQYKESNIEVFNDMKKVLKHCYSKIYEKVKEDFNDEWEDEE